MESETLESRLLLACAKVLTTPEDNAAIRQMLFGSVDWTIFAQKAVDRGLVSMAGHTLVRVAPDMVPKDILDALCTIIDETRAKNRMLLDELAQTIEASPIESPLSAIQNAYAAAGAALAVNPNDAEAWRNLGGALSAPSRRKEAIACFDRAIALAPDNAASWRDCGAAMFAMGQREAGLKYIDKALALDPGDARAWTSRAHALTALLRHEEAVEASDCALALDPENIGATRVRIHALLFLCDWRQRDDMKRRIAKGLGAHRPIITPFNHLAISHSEADNFTLARIWAKGIPPVTEPLWRGETYRHDKIRIAYISTDFRDTLSVNAIAGCFEGHDKTRFVTTAISLAPHDGSETRRRIEAAFDRFIDAQAMNGAQVAAMLRESEIDIVIDLCGYAGGRRTEILAARPVPVQVNYLGFAGTMAMPFFDYIIADRIVIPEEHRTHYSEKVVYLPDTFFPTDRRRQIAETTPSRTEAELPETDFVFANHNTAYKISPEIFDIWMRLLRNIEGSVLWLSSTIPSAKANLRREAEARGVAAERLVFAAKVARRADHLARLRLADLLVDTLPYNAHTTGTDALWAGLPVLTCRGNTFPARVASSQLYALGMPELVTTSLAEYEELALKLARDPKRLADIKARLMRNRDTEPLFDTARFTRYLESAYISMWERYQMGLPPMSFTVAS